PGEVERGGDGRRCADESWGRPVEGADALQAPDDVGDLASEQPAIRMQLVDDDELEAGEKSSPARVVRKDARMQHVRVGHHDVAGLANGCASTWCGVAVVRVDPDVDGEPVFESAQLRELILGKRFCRIYIEGPSLGVLEQALQNREVVPERLAAGGGCNHDRLAAVSNS